MSKPKVLIAHRPGSEIEAMLEDAPSELEICSCPQAKNSAIMSRMLKLSMAPSVNQIFPKRKRCVGYSSLCRR